MNIVMLILGIIIGGGIAFAINKLLSAKVENKNYKIALQISAYIVCILLSCIFHIIVSVRMSMNDFIDERILYFEENINVLTDTVKITFTGNNDFEKFVFNRFVNTLSAYQTNDTITVKQVLEYAKVKVVNTITPYLVMGQTALVIILFLYTGIYAGIVIFLKKGGATYNKSIVFGDEK